MAKRYYYCGLLIFLFVFLSCGVEDYIYLDPIPAGNVRTGANNVVEITLPNSLNQSSYFRYYSIYYRIYLSKLEIVGTVSEGNLNDINPVLKAHYDYIKQFTNVTASNTNISPSNIEYTFRSRNYNKIAVAGTNIESLLNTTADGGLLQLDFYDTGSSPDPLLKLNGVPYVLSRSLDSGTFNPKPDGNYTFKNSREMRDYTFIQDYNKDVQAYANDTTTEYCYVSIYIVKVGADNNWSPVYSFPTYIGIFLLPIDQTST